MSFSLLAPSHTKPASIHAPDKFLTAKAEMVGKNTQKREEPFLPC